MKSRESGVTGYLVVGDIIHVDNPLRAEELSYFKVYAIDGNKAKTMFRVFNRNIYCGGMVFEYGKNLSPIYNNSYTVVKNPGNVTIQ